jgi:5-methylcytosine-specific restriction endonuclease McrA
MRYGGSWSTVRNRLVRAAALEDRPCALCGGAIDYSASGRSRLGPQVDHIVAVERGGAMYAVENLQICHGSCNGAKAAALDPRRGGGSVRRQEPAPAKGVLLPVCGRNACVCHWLGKDPEGCEKGPARWIEV